MSWLELQKAEMDGVPQHHELARTTEGRDEWSATS